MDEKEQKKVLARKKRLISEVAGQIHDIVEDTLWSDYSMLPELSEKLQSMILEFEETKASFAAA